MGELGWDEDTDENQRVTKGRVPLTVSPEVGTAGPAVGGRSTLRSGHWCPQPISSPCPLATVPLGEHGPTRDHSPSFYSSGPLTLNLRTGRPGEQGTRVQAQLSHTAAV